MNAVPYDGGNGRLFDAHYANDGLGAGRFFFLSWPKFHTDSNCLLNTELRLSFSLLDK